MGDMRRHGQVLVVRRWFMVLQCKACCNGLSHSLLLCICGLAVPVSLNSIAAGALQLMIGSTVSYHTYF